MFVVQNDLFGNLIWIFFSLPDNGIFFLRCCCNTDICPMDFSSGELWKGPFFWLEEGENCGFQLLLPFGPGQQKFSFEMKTYCWTLAAFIDIKMDNYQLEDWWILWRSSCDLSWLNYCINLHFSTQRSLVISLRVNYCLLFDSLWLIFKTWLLIKVAGKAITTFDILGMLCLFSPVFHNIRLQSSHRQEWSLHKQHVRLCSIHVSSSLRIVQLTVVDKSINCFYIKITLTEFL